MADSETQIPAKDSDSFPTNLVHHLRALTRFVLVKTEEELLFIKRFSQYYMSKYRDRTWVFNAEYGLQLVSDYLTVKTTGRAHPPPLAKCSDFTFSNIPSHSREDMLNAGHNAMSIISAHDPGAMENFYLVTDPEVWFDDSLMVRRLVNLAVQLEEDPRVVKCLIFIGHPSVVIPRKLRQFFETTGYELSDLEIEAAVQHFIELFGDIEAPKDMSIFRGLTTFEIGSAITQSIVAQSVKTSEGPEKWKPHINPDFIRRYKDSRLVMR